MIRDRRVRPENEWLFRTTVIACAFENSMKELTDGLGLCSPGRWKPQARNLLADQEQLQHVLLRLVISGKRLSNWLCGTTSRRPFPRKVLRKQGRSLFCQIQKELCRYPIDNLSCSRHWGSRSECWAIRTGRFSHRVMSRLLKECQWDT